MRIRRAIEFLTLATVLLSVFKGLYITQISGTLFLVYMRLDCIYELYKSEINLKRECDLYEKEKV